MALHIVIAVEPMVSTTPSNDTTPPKKSPRRKNKKTNKTRNLNLLPNTRQQQPLIITARLPSDPARQIAVVALLIRSADVGHVVAVPVWKSSSVSTWLHPDIAKYPRVRLTVADHPADKQVVLGTRAGHGRLEQRGVVHVLVDGGAELEEQRILHMARKLL